MNKLTLIIFLLQLPVLMQAQIVTIPDPNFKNALVNTPCVIFGPPGDCSDVNVSVDINGDGEVQVIEAEAVDLLCVNFQNISSLKGIEAFVNLERLYVENNDLTSIDTSHNLLLKTLDCNTNNLSSINITQNTALEVLDVLTNQITDLDISGNSNLVYLNCRNNQLSSIDISNNINLLSLVIGYNELTTIDLSQNPNFGGLSIQNNYLTSIDISQNPSLSYLNISNNGLSSIDLSQNLLLEQLFIYDNNLSTIDVSQNPLLERLFIGGNTISSFDVSNNTLLEYFSFSESPLITGTIDLSQHTVLLDLRCENTSISGLNIKNGDPVLPYDLEAFNNPNLFCIDVDDAEAANAGTTYPYSTWEVDEQVTFSEDCQLGVEENDATSIVLSPNPVTDILWVYNENEANIINIKIYDAIGNLLIEQNNPLNQIDVSNLSTGLLFVNIETNKGITYKKILKN